MYDAIHYRANSPARVFDCTSVRRPTQTENRKIFALMPDGTVYAGVSPDTGRAMYATPEDTGLCARWHKVMDYAAALDAHGHKDWRVPTTCELNELFTNRAAIRNFNQTGSDPAGWYWSSSQHLKYYAWLQRFSDGYRSDNLKLNSAALRCVRG